MTNEKSKHTVYLFCQGQHSGSLNYGHLFFISQILSREREGIRKLAAVSFMNKDNLGDTGLPFSGDPSHKTVSLLTY